MCGVLVVVYKKGEMLFYCYPAYKKTAFSPANEVISFVESYLSASHAGGGGEGRERPLDLLEQTSREEMKNIHRTDVR